MESQPYRSPRGLRAFLCAAVLVLPSVALAEATPYLVKEINPAVTVGSNPSGLTNVNGTLFFAACDPAAGCELWKSDGTAAGTVRVADIDPGPGHSSPRCLTNVNGTVFFTAFCTYDYSTATDCELWKSDGTAAGTVQVVDITPGPGGSAVSHLTNVNGILFFRACDQTVGCGLWKTDGTPAGSLRVANVTPGGSDDPPSNLLNVNGTLYFNVFQARSQAQLWKSDGTAAGTILVHPRTGGDLAAAGGTLFFTVCDLGVCELWKSDGTQDGTASLGEIGAAYGDDDGPRAPFLFTPVALPDGPGLLFFRTGCDLWRSDGTPEGTVRVSELTCNGDDAPEFATVNGVILFQSCDGEAGCELWRADASPAGAARLADLNPGPGSSGPKNLAVVGESVFFTAFETGTGWALWKSDGTESGTARVAHIPPGYFYDYGFYQGFPNVSAFTDVNGTLFFGACELTTGCELWKSDGAQTGTVRVADIYPNLPTGSSNPWKLTRVGDTLFFVAWEPTTGGELWKSDGTEAGTVPVADLSPGPTSSRIEELADLNGTLFFTTSDERYSSTLWRSDGTDAGTVPVAGHDQESWHAHSLTELDGALFFAAYYPTGGSMELWRSDGTTVGTGPVADVPGFRGSNSERWLTRVGRTLFFVACDPWPDCELWRSDGTAAGTNRVADIAPGSTGSNPDSLTNVNGTLVFKACEPTTGCELWRSDGTEAGTARVADVAPGQASSTPYMLGVARGMLFLTIYRQSRYELWRSDGTAAGTLRLHVNPEWLGLGSPVSVNGTFFFQGCEPATGCELWKSDGTVEGTLRVTDINPGPGFSRISNLADVNGTLFFDSEERDAQQRQTYKRWASDGTAVGTILRGSEPSVGWNRMPVDGTLFFSANTPDHGVELWAVSTAGYPTVPPLGPCDPILAATDSCASTCGSTEGRPCDDGNACTTSDTCTGRVCVGSAERSCDDGNVCTTDSCDPTRGCVRAPNRAACNDGNACTTGDTCNAGRCAGRPVRDCDDSNPCTTDSCNAGTGCIHAPNRAGCDDRNPCTTSDRCTDGACVGGPRATATMTTPAPRTRAMPRPGAPTRRTMWRAMMVTAARPRTPAETASALVRPSLPVAWTSSSVETWKR